MVVSYRNSTSNHNLSLFANAASSLYLIEILHQTTTSLTTCPRRIGCILSKFYIKPQRYVACGNALKVVSYRNSTSNHNSAAPAAAPPVLYLIEILHQTTTMIQLPLPLKGCILSKFYIKPQQCICTKCRCKVVSYRNSTSNHNGDDARLTASVLYLIEILHQTTTSDRQPPFSAKLYLIEILHQTTTLWFPASTSVSLYLIEILHQTTTPNAGFEQSLCCILSKFYIKPQPVPSAISLPYSCILSKFYIKPQRRTAESCRCGRCILSKFYIKPQLSTSRQYWGNSCILSKFYIKPQLAIDNPHLAQSCILSKFYIKPQLKIIHGFQFVVVSYRNSTSNHNATAAGVFEKGLYLIEILHQTTTSRYAWYGWSRLYLIEILHQTTTRSGSEVNFAGLYLIEILHQTTTLYRHSRTAFWLYLIEILHQTTTFRRPARLQRRCILSKFYIKPQQKGLSKSSR